MNQKIDPATLKITDMRFADIDGAPKRCTLLKLYTNQGLIGYGEVRDASSRTYAAMLKSRILGENPCNIDKIFRRIKQFGGPSRQAGGVCGIEVALWDLAGKAWGVPVWQLLGGAVRDKIRVYANGWSGGATDPAVIRDKAQEAQAYGYAAFKFSLAIPSWPLHDTETVRRVAKAAETVRDAVGPDAAICFDGHGRYDSNLAIQIGRALEEYDLMFFEEPVQPEDEEGMLRVARSVNIPVAAGERLTRPQEFRRLIEKRAISIAQPDLAHCHGFNEGLKVAHLAEAFDAFVAPHCPMSPVITAISLHLDAIAPNFLIQERLFLNDWRNEVITEPLQVKEGFIELPKKPGWGIELDEELIRKHPRIVAGTPRLFRPDGAVCDW